MSFVPRKDKVRGESHSVGAPRFDAMNNALQSTVGRSRIDTESGWVHCGAARSLED